MKPIEATIAGHGNSVGNDTPCCGPASKWAAIINDKVVWMPDRHVHAVVLREQGGVGDDHLLFRDHNSDHDPVMPQDGKIDLGQGNIYYSECGCQDHQRPACQAPAKLGYIADDRWEVVTIPAQTGASLRALFNLDRDTDLFRDLKSPHDEPVGDADAADFTDGCVFRTGKGKRVLRIFVNGLPFTEHDGVKPEMTGREIALLVETKPENTTVTRITGGANEAVPLGETAKVADCDQFKVVRCNVNAGFQSERIVRELATLRESGVRVTLVEGSVPAVIYHDVPAKAGQPVAVTDVLVKIPSGYPAGIPDNAFLPEGSPLLQCTLGQPQHTETIGGRRWTQTSLHPHHPRKGVAWDKNTHGFHTYYGEMIHWLNQ